MSNQDLILEKVRAANPVPPEQELPYGGAQVHPPLADIVARTLGDEASAQHARPALGPPLFRRRGWVTAIPATVAVVALVGGIAWITRPTGGSSAPADQTVTPDTSQPAPPGGASAVGTFTWTSVSDDAGNLPSHGIVATPDGFISTGTEGWWTSSDGISWVREAPPLDATGAYISDTDAGYFLTETSRGGNRVWHSADAGAWDLLDLDAIGSPRLTGLDWSIYPWGSAESGDTMLVRWRLHGSVDWVSLLGIESDPAVLGVIGVDRFWDPDTRVLRIGTVDEIDDLDEVLAHLAFTVEGSGDSMTIEVTNSDTGAQVHTFTGAVDGLTTDELLNELALGDLNLVLLTVAEEDQQFDVVPTPWTPLGLQDRWEIVAHDDGFLTYSHDRSQSGAGPVVIWASDDGRTWTEVGTPAFAEDELVNWVWPRERDGRFLAHVRSEETERLAIWQSLNGIDWTPLATGPPTGGDVGTLMVADFGWVYAIDAGPVFSLWVSQDGIQWDQLDTSTLNIDTEPGPGMSGGSFGVTVADDTIFVILTENGAIPVDATGAPLTEETEPAATTMWIGALEG